MNMISSDTEALAIQRTSTGAVTATPGPLTILTRFGSDGWVSVTVRRSPGAQMSVVDDAPTVVLLAESWA
jgi:hypothetical protein